MLALLKTPNLFNQPLVITQNLKRKDLASENGLALNPQSVLINFKESKDLRAKIEIIVTPVFRIESYPYAYFVEGTVVHGRAEQENQEIVWSNGRINIIRDYPKFIENTQFLIEANDENKSQEVFSASFQIFKQFIRHKKIQDEDRLEYFYAKFTLGEKIERMIEGSDADNLKVVAKRKLQTLAIEVFDNLIKDVELPKIDPDCPPYEPHWVNQDPRDDLAEYVRMSRTLTSWEFQVWNNKKNAYQNYIKIKKANG